MPDSLSTPHILGVNTASHMQTSGFWVTGEPLTHSHLWTRLHPAYHVPAMQAHSKCLPGVLERICSDLEAHVPRRVRAWALDLSLLGFNPSSTTCSSVTLGKTSLQPLSPTKRKYYHHYSIRRELLITSIVQMGKLRVDEIR